MYQLNLQTRVTLNSSSEQLFIITIMVGLGDFRLISKVREHHHINTVKIHLLQELTYIQTSPLK